MAAGAVALLFVALLASRVLPVRSGPSVLPDGKSFNDHRVRAERSASISRFTAMYRDVAQDAAKKQPCLDRNVAEGSPDCDKDSSVQRHTQYFEVPCPESSGDETEHEPCDGNGQRLSQPKSETGRPQSPAQEQEHQEPPQQPQQETPVEPTDSQTKQDKNATPVGEGEGLPQVDWAPVSELIAPAPPPPPSTPPRIEGLTPREIALRAALEALKNETANRQAREEAILRERLDKMMPFRNDLGIDTDAIAAQAVADARGVTGGEPPFDEGDLKRIARAAAMTALESHQATTASNAKIGPQKLAEGLTGLGLETIPTKIEATGDTTKNQTAKSKAVPSTKTKINEDQNDEQDEGTNDSEVVESSEIGASPSSDDQDKQRKEHFELMKLAHAAALKAVQEHTASKQQENTVTAEVAPKNDELPPPPTSPNQPMDDTTTATNQIDKDAVAGATAGLVGAGLGAAMGDEGSKEALKNATANAAGVAVKEGLKMWFRQTIDPSAPWQGADYGLGMTPSDQNTPHTAYGPEPPPRALSSPQDPSSSAHAPQDQDDPEGRRHGEPPGLDTAVGAPPSNQTPGPFGYNGSQGSDTVEQGGGAPPAAPYPIDGSENDWPVSKAPEAPAAVTSPMAPDTTVPHNSEAGEAATGAVESPGNLNADEANNVLDFVEDNDAKVSGQHHRRVTHVGRLEPIPNLVIQSHDGSDLSPEANIIPTSLECIHCDPDPAVHAAVAIQSTNNATAKGGGETLEVSKESDSVQMYR